MLSVVAAVLFVAAAVAAVVTAIAVVRVADALSKVNVMSVLSYVALPLAVIGVFVQDTAVGGFDWHNLVRVVLAVVGLLVVASVSNFYAGRSIYNTEQEQHTT